MSELKVSQQYLLIVLNDQRILISISSVHLVLLIPALRALPDKNPAFAGMMNFHGKPVPIYDLSILMEKKPIAITVNTPLLLCYSSNEKLGLITDEIQEIIDIDKEKLHPPEKDAMPFVKHIYEQPTWMGWVLDVDALLRYNHIGVAQEEAHG